MRNRGFLIVLMGIFNKHEEACEMYSPIYNEQSYNRHYLSKKCSFAAKHCLLYTDKGIFAYSVFLNCKFIKQWYKQH